MAMPQDVQAEAKESKQAAQATALLAVEIRPPPFNHYPGCRYGDKGNYRHPQAFIKFVRDMERGEISMFHLYIAINTREFPNLDWFAYGGPHLEKSVWDFIDVIKFLWDMGI